MSQSERELRERDFVEHMGLLMQESAQARLHGRVLGRLMLCNPPEQSSNELATWLEASRGAISTCTRDLVVAGLIQRVAKGSDRSIYFKIREHAWADLMRVRMLQLTRMRQLAETGMSIVQEDAPELQTRVQEFLHLHQFFEAQMPKMVDLWTAEFNRSR